MEGSPFLPLPEGMLIDRVEQADCQLTVTVVSTRAEAACPGCGCSSEHVHSQYQRTVFAERLPDLVQPWARVSNRLVEELKAIGLSASAEVSERLTPRLGMHVKAPTLLRYLRTIPPAPKSNVTVLGIDDFALRRGDMYGTILINIETSKPLDLLPDRTAEAVMPWLSTHPEIQVVSRDRASAFADAVSRVLPHATQVADRYHLIQNLRDHLQQVLDRKRTCLPEIEDIPLKAGPTDDQGLRDSLADQASTVDSR